MRIRSLLTIVLLFSVGFAPAPFTKSKELIERADSEKLQGVWIEMSRLHGGKNDMVAGEAGTTSMVVEGNSIKFVREGKVVTEWTFLNVRKVLARSSGQKQAVFQRLERLLQRRRIRRVDVNCGIHRGTTQHL